MKTLKLTGILLVAILTSLAMSNGAWAKKGGKPGGGGGGTDSGHVSMVATGAVDAGQDCDERLSADDTSYRCNDSGVGHTIFLGEFFMNHVYPNDPKAKDCFGPSDYRVSISVDLNKNGSAETAFWFHAFKGDGTTEVLYVLAVNDPRGWSGAFPPAVTDTTTMGEFDEHAAITWDLGASNKQQERNACVDSGTFTSDSIKVDFTRIE